MSNVGVYARGVLQTLLSRGMEIDLAVQTAWSTEAKMQEMEREMRIVMNKEKGKKTANIFTDAQNQLGRSILAYLQNIDGEFLQKDVATAVYQSPSNRKFMKVWAALAMRGKIVRNPQTQLWYKNVSEGEDGLFV